jgi:predicted nucleic acid-binding protein
MDMEEQRGVADTGFVVALLNRTDAKHQVAVDEYARQPYPILLPQTFLAEVAYLIGQVASITAVATFLRELPTSQFQLVALTDQDVQRIAEILQQYADSRVDFVDASVMAIAERHEITTVLTLDHRDFRLFRPRHCPYFDLLP